MYHFYLVKGNSTTFKLGITRQEKRNNRLYTLRTYSFANALWIGYTLPMSEDAARMLETEFKRWKGVQNECCNELTARRIIRELQKRDIPFKLLNKISVTMPDEVVYKKGDFVFLPVTSEMESLAKNDSSHCVIAIGARNARFNAPRIKEGQAWLNHNGYTLRCIVSGADQACINSFDSGGKFGERVVKLEVIDVTPIKQRTHIKQKNKSKGAKRKNSGATYCNNRKRHHGVSAKSINLRDKTQVDFTKRVA